MAGKRGRNKKARVRQSASGTIKIPPRWSYQHARNALRIADSGLEPRCLGEKKTPGMGAFPSSITPQDGDATAALRPSRRNRRKPRARSANKPPVFYCVTGASASTDKRRIQ